MISLKYIALLLLIVTSLFSLEPQFTKDELQWIKDNPTVKFGADYKWPPFDFADSKGKHTGLASEYIKLISKKSGLKIKTYHGPIVGEPVDAMSDRARKISESKGLLFSLKSIHMPEQTFTMEDGSKAKVQITAEQALGEADGKLGELKALQEFMGGRIQS